MSLAVSYSRLLDHSLKINVELLFAMAGVRIRLLDERDSDTNLKAKICFFVPLPYSIGTAWYYNNAQSLSGMHTNTHKTMSGALRR